MRYLGVRFRNIFLLGVLITLYSVLPANSDDRLAGVWMRVSATTAIVPAYEVITIAADRSVTVAALHPTDTCQPIPFTSFSPDACGKPMVFASGTLQLGPRTIGFAPNAKISAAAADPRDDFFARPFRFSPYRKWNFKFQTNDILVLTTGTYEAKYFRVDPDLPAVFEAVVTVSKKSLSGMACTIMHVLADRDDIAKFAALGRSINAIYAKVILPYQIAEGKVSQAESNNVDSKILRALERKWKSEEKRYSILYLLENRNGKSISDAEVVEAAGKLGVMVVDLRTWLTYGTWLKSKNGASPIALFPSYDLQKQNRGRFCKITNDVLTTVTSETIFAAKYPKAFKAALRDMCEGKYGKLPQPKLFASTCKNL